MLLADRVNDDLIAAVRASSPSPPVTGGDGWVIAVEFRDVPRAYSILAYGESAREDSPHHTDQAEMFARGEMKRVAFAEQDIEAQTIRRYRPGSEAQR